MVLVARLRLDHDLPAGKVDRDIERAAAHAELATEQPLDRIRRDEIGYPVAQIVNERPGKEVGQRIANQVRGFHAEEGADVERSARDDPVGADCDEEADGLDGAQDVNGFSVAIRQVDRGTGISHNIPACKPSAT